MSGSSSRGVPWSVSVCPNGCVRMQFGVATIHLSLDSFHEFMRAAQQALVTTSLVAVSDTNPRLN